MQKENKDSNTSHVIIFKDSTQKYVSEEFVRPLINMLKAGLEGTYEGIETKDIIKIQKSKIQDTLEDWAQYRGRIEILKGLAKTNPKLAEIWKQKWQM